MTALATDWFTWALIAVVFVAAGIWFAVFTIRAIKADSLDAASWLVCGIGRCRKPAVATYDRHPSGAVLVCKKHAARLGVTL